jgi:uncharacterized membrane protein YjjB (DUF3815 family)
MPRPSIGPVPNAEPGRLPIQKAALAFGILFAVLGVLAFIPGLTTQYDRLDFVQHDARLFGVFWTSGLDNVVHLAFGVLGVVLSRSAFGSAVYLGVGGVFYLLIWLYSVLADPSRSNDQFALGTADWVLHVALALGMVVVAILTRPRRTGVTPALNDPPLDGTPRPN